MPADRDLASYAELGDATLGALVAERDGQALEALYDRYGTACYSLAKRIVVDTGLAQDVVQEVFLTLWRNAGRFDTERGSLSTYLLSITHHKSVDVVRKEERQRSRRAPAEVLELIDSGQDVDGEAWTELRRTKVRSGPGRPCPDPQRETLVLAYFGGYTQQEIARLTDTPLGTVKTRTLAALRRLETRLGRLRRERDGRWGTVSDHEEWEELAAAHALGALEPEDEQRFEAHLLTCRECAPGPGRHRGGHGRARGDRPTRSHRRPS